jgi:nucleotide-binding universal stress UspA family protein
MKVLFAVDGSEYTSKAAHYIAKHFHQLRAVLDLHLLHVQLPIPPGLALVQAERLLGSDVDERYYKDESEAALAPAEHILRKHQIPFQSLYKVGDIAQEIHHYATKNKMDMIVMGSHGRGAFRTLLLGSVAAKVMSIESDIPVLIVR